MSVIRVRAIRSAGFVSALLLSTALAAPAFAQIEEVVVTAQKKSEDVMTVPIAISAYTSKDLQEHQVTQFKDLQFSSPSVSYTKTNFTSSNFQIRGIGTQVISGDAESGVAFNINDAYYATAPVDSGQFYDIQRIEVLRGPQSTLYGRGATGGVVSVFSNKPELDTFAADLEATYGNYNASEIKAMVNVPIITDKLGLRLAGDWVRHDGYSTNIYPGASSKHADSRNSLSGRASLRWQPNSKTTLDITASIAHEHDSRMRAQKQLCHTDPSGVLGCLPDKLASEPVNLNATFYSIPVSKQALGTVFTPLYESFGYSAAQAYGIASGLGVFDLSQPFTAPAGAVPSDPRTINSDFSPTLRGNSFSFTAEWKQSWAPWLDSTMVLNTARGDVNSQESYTNFPAANFNPVAIATAIGTLQNTLNSYVGAGLVPASYADPVNGPYAFLLNPSHAGTLPVSNVGKMGVISGDIARYAPGQFTFDQSSGRTSQKSIDFRVNTDFSGPLNAMLAGYYLHTEGSGDYYVSSNALDYGQTLFGALLGPVSAAPLCVPNGCIYGTPYYDNRTSFTSLNSSAVYGEVYYTLVPDTLKITVGARYTSDEKVSEGGIYIFNGFVPIGSSDQAAAMAALAQQGQMDLDPNKAGNQSYYHVRTSFDKLTGRAVIDYTPKLSFTDYTLIYASYSKGYKAGGSNPGIQANNLGGLPTNYSPEVINAYEIGTKNTLFDGTVQANASGYYYDYGGYQISSIIANTSVNTNISAKIYGVEGELKWAPSSRWQFNFSFDAIKTQVGNSAQIDPRNPGGNDPNALVLKDGQLSATNAQNCVLYHSGPNSIDADFALLHALAPSVFYAVNNDIHALKGSGVANAAYGSCYGSTNPADPFYGLSLKNPTKLGALLAAAHFSMTDPAYKGSSLTGVPVNINGNQLANTPPFSFSIGGQYTQPFDSGYSVTTRFDYYWQTDMWGRIFKDGADKIQSWGVANAQMTLNSPDGDWYARVWVRNLANSNNMTGEYLTSSSSALWTGAFYGDPRTFGLTLGAHF